MLRLLFLFLSLSLSAIKTFSAAAGGGGRCNRQCSGNVVVPYPFGFSGDCPIRLACNATASMALLPHSTAGTPYPILKFNSTASTFLVSVAPSCSRSVPEARASLNGAGYGVSSRSAIFLRGGGCRAPGPSNCSVNSNIMYSLLRTAKCGDVGATGNDTAAWTCVVSPAPAPGSAAAARGQRQFLEWDKVQGAGCDDALTATVYGDLLPQGMASLEFGVAELGWWLNGTCKNATGGGQCAQNATCRDVETPSGAWGHRCGCPDGLAGDGFAAGDGCHFGVGT